MNHWEYCFSNPVTVAKMIPATIVFTSDFKATATFSALLVVDTASR